MTKKSSQIELLAEIIRREVKSAVKEVLEDMNNVKQTPNYVHTNHVPLGEVGAVETKPNIQKYREFLAEDFKSNIGSSVVDIAKPPTEDLTKKFPFLQRSMNILDKKKQ